MLGCRRSCEKNKKPIGPRPGSVEREEAPGNDRIRKAEEEEEEGQLGTD